MRGTFSSSNYICARCIRAGVQSQRPPAQRLARHISTTSPRRDEGSGNGGKQPAENGKDGEEEQGAMSRRLAQMTEESLETGGRSAQKAVSEAGFSDELKRQLEDRIKDASFRSENAQAFAQANLPSAAGAGTRDIAGATPWSGTESVEDASLRMLNDSFKPLKAPARSTPSVRVPQKIDTGRSSKKSSAGGRLANARDKTSMYSYLKDPSLNESDREQFRKQLKEKFQPGARAVPATIQGLASLANERIEDAIARGQFKNIPRGKKIERDYNASNPFLDTTEYFMNKIIQKQEIVPPWIEKQQELVSTATRFRARLRNDWKRYVARTIASRGGSLESQIALAKAYAVAEAQENPSRVKVEKINTVDDEGHLSQITVSGDLKPSGTENNSDASSQPQITVTEETLSPSGAAESSPQQLTISETSPPPPPPSPPLPSVPGPFRDPTWLATESSYHALAIADLNTIARSYNLMAPTLAKKPYFNLERELRSCYADVAPLVAEEIGNRAPRPMVKVEVMGHKKGGVLERFGGEKGRVFEERKPRYGFREFWRDLFRKD